MSITVGSLFAGIGGFDLGFDNAGFDVIWQVENNLQCQHVLKLHWPNVPVYGDIRDCGVGRKHELERPDIYIHRREAAQIEAAARRVIGDESAILMLR